MLKPTLQKNDPKAKLLIWLVSIVVFVATVVRPLWAGVSQLPAVSRFGFDRAVVLFASG